MRVRGLRPVTAAAGIVVLLGATFAPWVVSGATSRNAYGAAGAGERLLRLDAPVAAAVRALPFVGLAFALAMLLWLAGRADVAAGLMLVLDVAAITAAVAALSAPRTGPVHAVAIGPIVMICGALITMAAILPPTILRVLRAWSARSPATSGPPARHPHPKDDT